MKKLALLALIAALSACGDFTYQRYEASPLSAARVQEVKAVILETLRDPASAQFRDIRLVTATRGNGNTDTWVCGEVNAKNAFGGYVGFSPFIGEFRSDGFVQTGTTPGSEGLAPLLCNEA